jgi:hypothetical protein
MERACSNARLLVDSRLNSSMSENRATGFCSFHAGVPPGLLASPSAGDRKAEMLFEAGRLLALASEEEFGTENRQATLADASWPLAETLFAELDMVEFTSADGWIDLYEMNQNVSDGIFQCLNVIFNEDPQEEFSPEVADAVDLTCNYDFENRTFSVVLASGDIRSSAYLNVELLQ